MARAVEGRLPAGRGRDGRYHCTNIGMTTWT